MVYIAAAVLNSPIAKFYYLIEYPELKTCFPHIRGKDIGRLPLPNGVLLQSTQIVESIVENVRSLEDKVRSGRARGSRIYETRESKQIDDLLLGLYDLTDDECSLMRAYLGE